MMNRIFSLILAVIFACGLPVSAFAADKNSAAQTHEQVVQREKEIEKKYGISVEYPTNSKGYAAITMNTLETLDQALDNVTPALVKKVSEYYKEKNGKKLTFSYVKDSSKLGNGEGSEATFGGFYTNRSLIELYIPSSSGHAILLSGDNPLTIVHEFGHAFHFMYTDKYGLEKMKAEWEKFNGSSSYSAGNIMQNPNDKRFVSGYAATMFEEDVAETFAHVFVRNRAGQGLKSKLTSGGNQSDLGKKVAYVEQMLLTYCKETDDAVVNYRKIYNTATSMTYQGMKFSGDYLQYAGYPQPAHVLNGTLKILNMSKDSAVWIRKIGGWYVKQTNGEEIIVFPGGAYTKVSAVFEAPKSAA